MDAPTVTPPASFVKRSEVADLRADIARADVKHNLLAQAVGLAPAKLSKKLHGKLRLTRTEHEEIYAALRELIPGGQQSGVSPSQIGQPVEVAK